MISKMFKNIKKFLIIFLIEEGEKYDMSDEIKFNNLNPKSCSDKLYFL